MFQLYCGGAVLCFYSKWLVLSKILVIKPSDLTNWAIYILVYRNKMRLTLDPSGFPVLIRKGCWRHKCMVNWCITGIPKTLEKPFPYLMLFSDLFNFSAAYWHRCLDKVVTERVTDRIKMLLLRESKHTQIVGPSLEQYWHSCGLKVTFA